MVLLNNKLFPVITILICLLCIAGCKCFSKCGKNKSCEEDPYKNFEVSPPSEKYELKQEAPLSKDRVPQQDH